MCKCPYCGKDIKLEKATWIAQAKPFSMVGDSAANLKPVPQSDYYAQPAPTTVLPGARIETPVAQQNLESNVKVPLAQALVTGALVGAAVSCVTTGAVVFFDVPKPLLVMVGPPFLAMLRTTYCTWTSGVSMADSLLTRIEDFTGVDWNRDGKTGSQPTPEIELGLMVHGKDGLSKLLLPSLPRHQVRRMVRSMGVLFLSGRLPDDQRYNVTRRNLGQPCGDYLRDVQATLLELGLVELAGNNTHVLTDLGAEWLTDEVLDA